MNLAGGSFVEPHPPIPKAEPPNETVLEAMTKVADLLTHIEAGDIRRAEESLRTALRFLGGLMEIQALGVDKECVQATIIHLDTVRMGLGREEGGDTVGAARAALKIWTSGRLG